MEFVGNSSGGITFDPEAQGTQEQQEQIQAALGFFRANAGHVRRLTERVDELGRSGEDTVITIIDVDDPAGALLADKLVPNHNWQQARDEGKTPVARAIAYKGAMLGFLQAAGYNVALEALSATDNLSVLVLHSKATLVLGVDFDSSRLA